MENNTYVSGLHDQVKEIDLEINQLLDRQEIHLIPLEDKYKKIFLDIAGERAFAKYLEGNKWEDIIKDKTILRKLTQVQGHFELESIRLNIEFGMPVLARCRKRESLVAEIQKSYIKLPESHLLWRVNT